MDAMVAMATGFSAINVVLLVGLIYLYARMASKTRSGYTFGLMLFSGLLLTQNSLMVYVCGFMSGLYNWQLDPFLASLALTEFVGLLALLWITF